MKTNQKQTKSKKPRLYLTDTSIVAQKKLCRIIKNKNITGILLIPNAVIAELENLANRGVEAGFDGLEEIAKLHHLKQIKIHFLGPRPNDHQIKFAKSGEIDAMIRQMAFQEKACLITADKVQGKSALAYGLNVLFIKTKFKEEKKKFFLFGKPKKKKRKFYK